MGSCIVKQSAKKITDLRVQSFLISDLEDKVHFNGGGNVMNPIGPLDNSPSDSRDEHDIS